MIRVLLVASEAHPLVKTGGLGDVAGALPGALRRIGVDARLLLPGYPAVLDAIRARTVAREVALLPGAPRVSLLQAKMPDDAPLYVLRAPGLFERAGGPYQDERGAEWPDNAARFATLSRMAARIAEGLVPFVPDLLHLNDWQTGLTAAYRSYAGLADTRVLMSVHNIAFGGLFDPALAPALGLPVGAMQIAGYEFHGYLGFLKAGIYYADHVSTVSPRYAEEIRTEAFGGGLHGLLAALGDGVSGIVNGIDVDVWSPEHDPHIARRYDEHTVERKVENKRALQAEVGLAVSDETPLLGVVSRLTHQKGIDLLLPALSRLPLRELQLVVLGSGAPELERALAQAEALRPDAVRFLNRFDEGLAHRIEAGADLFLMPSRFEPCGLNQMYSMRYGTPPVVRRTGGLADTVVDATPQALAAGTATGFVFDEADASALAAAVGRGLDLLADADAWRGVQRAAMRRDFSWAASAGAYRALYERLCPQAAAP